MIEIDTPRFKKNDIVFIAYSENKVIKYKVKKCKIKISANGKIYNIKYIYDIQSERGAILRVNQNVMSLSINEALEIIKLKDKK